MTYETVLLELAERYPELVVMTAENRAAIRNMPQKLGERFIDVGICEQTMIGAAAGLALRGRIPVVHALACFLTMRAYEFIRTDVGIAKLPVKLVGYVPGFLSTANGPTHQAIEDIAIMRGIPGMQVVCPADREELLGALPEIVASNAPCYMRYYDGEPKVTHRDAFKLGKAEVLSEGRDVTLLTYGFLLAHVEEAKKKLEQRGFSVGLVNVRTLKPIDETTMLTLAKTKTPLVTIEDHFVTGGLFSILAELTTRHTVATRIIPIALEDRWFKPTLLDDVLECEGFTSTHLAERIEKLLLKTTSTRDTTSSRH